MPYFVDKTGINKIMKQIKLYDAIPERETDTHKHSIRELDGLILKRFLSHWFSFWLT